MNTDIGRETYVHIMSNGDSYILYYLDNLDDAFEKDTVTFYGCQLVLPAFQM